MTNTSHSSAFVIIPHSFSLGHIGGTPLSIQREERVRAFLHPLYSLFIYLDTGKEYASYTSAADYIIHASGCSFAPHGDIITKRNELRYSYNTCVAPELIWAPDETPALIGGSLSLPAALRVTTSSVAGDTISSPPSYWRVPLRRCCRKRHFHTAICYEVMITVR